MYSFKKVPVTVYDYQTVNFWTPHKIIIKIILTIVNKVYILKASAEITNIGITLMTKVSAHVNTSRWG